MSSYDYGYSATAPPPATQSCVHTGDPSWPYFVEGSGIEHHVIQTDICRYLGSDSSLKRATHQGAEGFKFNAYRPFTTSMIKSLREDSAKWGTERRENWNRTKGEAPNYHKSRTFGESVARNSRQQQQPPATDYPQDYTRPAERPGRGGPPTEPAASIPQLPVVRYADSSQYPQYDANKNYDRGYVDPYPRPRENYRYDPSGPQPAGANPGAEIPRGSYQDSRDPRGRGERPSVPTTAQPEGYWMIDESGNQVYVWARPPPNHE